MEQSLLDNWFVYHPPTEKQLESYAAIRGSAKALAELFNNAVPDCAD